MVNPLINTKLSLPSLRSTLVHRMRLFEKLNQSLTHKLTLISAGAGFGKTTLLSEWAHQIKFPVSWLSLDQQDNDPIRFWTYIVAALQQQQGDTGETTLTMLRSKASLSSEVYHSRSFLIPLINELTQLQANIILVLDDYHLITNPTIHDTLMFLIDHLPAQVHLAIITRVNPPMQLAKLRASAELLELLTDDLRFTDAETTTFLNQSLSNPLTETHIAALQTQTEGWIVGLQLAMLSLQETADPAALIASFRGSQRSILDYLVEEVLEQQPQPIQTFLLRTSILGQMCGSLCEAVVGADVANSFDTLEQLDRRNLFIVSLDSERVWYRYHHLFAEVLRHILQQTEPDSISFYHHRAAQWYEQRGHIADAIQHAINAARTDKGTSDTYLTYAARLIERVIQSYENPPFDTIVLRNALAELPAQLTQTRPWLLVAKAWTAFNSSQFAEAISAIQILERWLYQNPSVPEETDQLWGIVNAMKGAQARQQGDTVASELLLEKALQLLPPDSSWLRLLILLNLSVTYFVADNYKSARRLLPEVSYIGQSKGMADPAIAGLYLQAQFLALRGRISEATALCQQGLELAMERRWLATYAGVLVQVALADLLRQQNQLETAALHLTQSIDRAVQNHQPGLMMGYVSLARVRQAQGDSQSAWTAIYQAERCQIWTWPTILSVEACKVRLELAEGNIDAATAWAERSGLTVEDALHYSTTEPFPLDSELDYLTYARVLLAQGQRQASPHNLQATRHLLNRLFEFAKAGGRTIRVLETFLLQAMVWQAQGDYKQSLEYLVQALQIPGHGRYLRLFLDEGKPMAKLLKLAISEKIYTSKISRLLNLFGLEENASNQLLIEPLSKRELDVIHYLAAGMTNQTIANQLHVSLAAVKWHAHNIYGKLEVNNRTQAVIKARKLGILS